MPTSTEALSVLSKEDLIGTVQALEDSLAEAATGLMKEGSAQEYAALRVRHEVQRHNFKQVLENHEFMAAALARLPRLIRWWYGC